MRRNHRWIDYEIYLREHPEASASEVAKVMNVSQSAVFLICRNHGYKFRKSRFRKILGVNRDELTEYAKAHTRYEIAEHFNLNPKALSCALNIHNIEFIKTRTKNPSAKRSFTARRRTGEVHDMIRTLAKTYNYASIARVFGYTRERVRQICLLEEV